jgi:uroporphyrinogen decarboxylase
MSPDKLSHCERVRLALEHRKTDRVPIAMVCAAVNDWKTFDNYLLTHRNISAGRYFEPILDIIEIGPDYIGPSRGDNEDYWGVIREPVNYGPSCYEEIVYYPLKNAKSIDDLRAHCWPKTDWFDYESISRKIERANQNEPYCVMVKGGNLFESAWYMRGFENTFMDMAINPELIHDIMDRVTQFYIAHVQRIMEIARDRVDLVFTADDIGGQNGLLMSIEMWQEFIKPYHVKLNRTIHDYGAKVIYHSDGAVMDAVPGLIDMGIDVLQALQFDAQGMDPVALKEKYGDRLCFEGGISVQKTLPLGTPEDVRAEVRQRIRILGKGGGFILGPSHQIQFGTPPENIAALFDTGMACSDI